MVERRTIGQILTGLGKITEADVQKALEHQRDHGGYFGEALIACGLLTRKELEFTLASQFDLPYIFPDAEAVDAEAAALVSPQWALSNLALPLMITGDTLKVVVDSPMNSAPLEELEERTGLQIEPALAAADVIRDVIRQVYARGVALEADEDDESIRGAVHLTEAVAAALQAHSRRFGISTRGHRSWAWWDDTGTIRRRRLEGLWQSELEELLDPSMVEHVEGRERASWEARIVREGNATPVQVHYLADESGHEFLFRPTEPYEAAERRFTPPPEGVVQEIRMLARSGSARFIVTSHPPDVGHEILPHLPTLLLPPSWRSIYINAASQAAAERAFSLKIPDDADRWAEELETLQAFRFDVVTVDLTGRVGEWAGTALDVASVAFLLWPDDEDREPAYQEGIRWELRVVREDGEDDLTWSLNPLQA